MSKTQIVGSGSAMEKTLFEYTDYKEYLYDWIAGRKGGGRGIKVKIATHLKCHNAYISQVLNGTAHFSLEQGERLLSFLDLGPPEGRFFILLLQYARAGTPTLRSFFQSEIDSLLDQRQILRKRFTFQNHLSRENQAVYYSSWMYMAVHLSVSLPGCDKPQSLASYLSLPREKVLEILDFLSAVGLVKENSRGGWEMGQSTMHLGTDAPMLSKHHINWRLKGLQSIERGNPQSLHYSSVITVSATDLPRVKEVLIAAIQTVRNIVRDSENEKIACYSIDCFELES